MSDSVTPWIAAHQAPLSMGFLRQEYWSGLPFLSPGEELTYSIHCYRFKKLLKMTRRKLNEYENGELSFHGDLKTSQTEMDIQINMLKHKVIFNQF